MTANEKGLRSLGDRINQEANRRTPANHEGLTSLADEMKRQSKSRADRGRSDTTNRRWRRTRRGIVIGLAALLVVALTGAGYAYYLTHSLHRVEVRGLSGPLTTGREGGTENILMMGSTSRCALTVQNPAYGLCSEGINGVNSDVIMILHVDPATRHLALLSIPRDLFIPNARADGANKIDAGLFEGPTQLVAAIEEDFGIPIQHTVEVNFDQFANVVDALGGINMFFPMSLFDANSGLNVQAAPCVHLNGVDALQVVRARELQYDDDPSTDGPDAEYWPKEALSDLARIRRDHEFLRVLATAVSKKGLGNPVTDLDLINSVKGDLTFDADWPVSDMQNLVLDFHSVNIGSVPQLTLPVSVVYDPDGPPNTGDYEYEGSTGFGYGDVEFPAEVQDQSAIDQVLGINATTDSMTGTPLPAPAAVTVSVQNGSGTYNQAAETASALSALGFKATAAGDVSPVGDLSETVVYYGSRAPAEEADAEAVTRSMSGAVIMAYDPSQVTAGSEVTVVTGTQFSVNAPAAPAVTPAPVAGSVSSSTSAPAAPTTTTTTTTTNPNIATPSVSDSQLEPWDPRTCAAGATPTSPVANQT